MDGRRIVKSGLRIGVKVDRKLRYCVDDNSWNGKMPTIAEIDLESPNVFLLNGETSADFESIGCRHLKSWRQVVNGDAIARVNVVMYDPKRTTRNKLQMDYAVYSRESKNEVEDDTEDGENNEELADFTLDDTQDGNQPREDSSNQGKICSIYPPGVIDTFDGDSTNYDLNCFHVLAADVGHANTWFIYGKFDDFDGKRSMAAMTFYVGAGAFEIQRGWMIAFMGEKYKIMEGEKQFLPVSNCEVLFANLHLTVDCRPGGYPFIATYDGYMLAHIELTQPGERNVGLCSGPSTGRRVNWQIPSSGECSIAPDKADCATPNPECDVFADACDESAIRMCNEITCDGPVTPEQMCSVELAVQKKCSLKGLSKTASTNSCPTDVCLRKFFVLGAGCPQDSFFTDCPMDKYLA